MVSVHTKITYTSMPKTSMGFLNTILHVLELNELMGVFFFVGKSCKLCVAMKGVIRHDRLFYLESPIYEF